MHNDRAPDEWIASHTGPGAIDRETGLALGSLGYRLVGPPNEGCEDGYSASHPHLRLVDDRYLHRVPTADTEPDTPIILLTGARQRPSSDFRVVGQTSRPADLHRLYPLLQHALAHEPRRTPRVETDLWARRLGQDSHINGRIVSLSTGGCRFRGSRSPVCNSLSTLQISIPEGGLVHCRARCVWSKGRDTGFEFVQEQSRTSPIIQRYVMDELGRDRAEPSFLAD